MSNSASTSRGGFFRRLRRALFKPRVMSDWMIPSGRKHIELTQLAFALIRKGWREQKGYCTVSTEGDAVVIQIAMVPPKLRSAA